MNIHTHKHRGAQQYINKENKSSLQQTVTTEVSEVHYGHRIPRHVIKDLGVKQAIILHYLSTFSFFLLEA